MLIVLWKNMPSFIIIGVNKMMTLQDLINQTSFFCRIDFLFAIMWNQSFILFEHNQLTNHYCPFSLFLEAQNLGQQMNYWIQTSGRKHLETASYAYSQNHEEGVFLSILVLVAWRISNDIIARKRERTNGQI